MIAGLLDAVAKSLLAAERLHILAARVLSLNATSGILVAVSGWRQAGNVATGPPQLDLEDLSLGSRPDPTALPWFPQKQLVLAPPRFMDTHGSEVTLGRWTTPYYACVVRRWLMSYTVVIQPQDAQQQRFGLTGLLSVDVDVSDLDVNQCPGSDQAALAAFLGTHKCHEASSTMKFPYLTERTFCETEAWLERESNTSSVYDTRFRCLRCAPGCANCTGPEPCLADYNWPFRITLLTVTCACVLFTLILIGYVVKHHKLKVFKVASPTFLSITLLGCAIMYLEMAAIFPVLDMYSCVTTKWTRHLGFCEVLFLAWGIRVCYNVRNAESLYNEARLISYAIYNIAAVNIAMVAFHLLIFPRAGPDIKYLLGFIRTQLSTTVTVALVFGPKVYRVLRGHGDQYDSRARARGVTASFSLNGIGLVPEEPPDLYQENEELKEEIQKLAAQIEFMRIVHMEMNNRHLKPKPGGYFSSASAGGKSHSSRSEPSDVSGGIPSDVAGPSVASTSGPGDRL
ncbi:hypothetical protein B566_EDAN012641 [Ephemera danica]|nr:hypothetical protein B566_EDAN012641 [Ephemera danica]